ncbi:MAG: RcnB family protein, partial [Sphingobium sp.]
PSAGWQSSGPGRDWANREPAGRPSSLPNDRRGDSPNFGRPDNGRPGVGRPDAGRPGYARPGNDWQDRARISNADRWRDQRRWSNDWRRDSRYDWSRYRQMNRNVYRMPAYRPPMGWNYGYSRFSIGVFLGSPLFASSYWLDDPYSYRLPPAYGTLRWVRYYDDALLVDIRDGYIVDVIHDFFW